MTKVDIVERIHENIGITKRDAALVLETVLETMKEALERGEKIKISGFGNFVVREKGERKGRNPQTGAPLTIKARRVLTFKVSPVFKNAINSR